MPLEDKEDRKQVQEIGGEVQTNIFRCRWDWNGWKYCYVDI